ncbi:hypothetical protein AAC03nite_09570 [Alicyclobacillus acidoterrestris]|uniref:winged helix-turn-helix domain-containing protein n=1 Tax=Alicyclobacillus suci TaxID=2816080 RepID=UPI0011912F27|nr:winged helix-turn-helix domain-containing protein [Alicyclobacillus suci]GEO25172.1 hypothetical protein AAC03nite_09570 [Alicyclobacillus acidoterrestris]
MHNFGETESHISLGVNCYLDTEDETLFKDGLKINLSRIQYKLLLFLAQNIGHLVPTEELIRHGWGRNKLIDKDELYVYMKRIRNKLEDNPKEPKCLITERGFGYVLYPRE